MSFYGCGRLSSTSFEIFFFLFGKMFNHLDVVGDL